MRATQQTIDLLIGYYSAMETNDPSEYGRYYAEDMTLTFAPSPTITGRGAIIEAMSGLLGRVRTLRHELTNVWEEDGGVIVYETLGTWTLHDGQSVSIFAASVATAKDGRFTDQRIYVDNSPLFELLDASGS